MVEINEHKYSKEPFDDYEYRARISMEIVEVKDHKVVERKADMDIYTTDYNKQRVENLLFELSAENVIQLLIMM